ncbi:conserved hypothetical protein [Hyella patelloides LEGE 07179]|uniref:Uncharacterized protein n=1 Tax=Hyella patelloides LEGE 07179 TaxID=945734 RepID=A0A563VZL1_9CYAN|nr:AraC family transcriptional regulator [Hyella patelloides]VEP16807.1 conserved hypothetical protein [Hyella patelloides LEGE 07179]
MIHTNSLFQSKHFMSLPCNDGMLSDLSQDQHPTQVYAWGYQHKDLTINVKGTSLGFVYSGQAAITFTLSGREQTFNLDAGMYFSVPNNFYISDGCGFITTRLGYQGTFTIGGPIEKQGRLLYIDGCSDSLLIPPVIKGDPCLNYLHFPPHIGQTRHTHPSMRVGIVAKGRGRCVVPSNDDGTGSDITIPLIPGNVFIIPTDGHHSFFTDDSEMDVIAYHPDSDTGPTHNDHPMINRTIVDGVSAAHIQEIRTAKIGL